MNAGQPRIVQAHRCRTLRHGVSRLEAQEQIAHGFWQRNLKGKGLEWGGLWADEAVSAFKRPLLRRANGQKFVTVAKPGDHIVVTRFYRCFRSMLEIVRLRDAERILCWETIAVRMRQMQRDARRAGIDKLRAFPRVWSWESCQRAYAAFWTVLVVKEGTSWIADPTIKNLAEVRLAEG
jgi:hypothetical protein